MLSVSLASHYIMEVSMNDNKVLVDAGWKEHNYNTNDEGIEKLLFMIHKVEGGPNKDWKETVDRALYRYGGTVCSALIDMLFNNIGE